MLLIKRTNLSLCSNICKLPVLTLFYLINSSHCLAGNTEENRQEPIQPIPLQVDVDANKARLGEFLFFDTRLSRTNTLACASCHQLETGGDDNVAMGISSSSGQHIINTASVFNAIYNFRQNWDGAFITLHEQIDAVVKSQHEFNNSWDEIIARLSTDANLVQDFNAIYTDGILKENIQDAIVEFEKTLITPNSRFDRYLRNEANSLTKEEIEGYLAFKNLGCISCHQGINIGGNLFQKFGVFYNYIAERGDIKNADYGRINITKRQMDEFVFKVPSLRNIATTAPYLHDGSAQTLEEAVSIMGKTQLGRTLSTEEIRLITLFLNTLTGQYKNISLGKKL